MLWGRLPVRTRVTTLVAVAYVAWNGIAGLFNTAEASGDTERYFTLPLSAPVNTGLVPPLVFRMVADYQRIMWVHIVISTMAWLVLALVVQRRFLPSRLGVGMAAVVLLFSMTTPVWCWNTLLYSESLTISACVLWLASLIALTDARWKRQWTVLLSSAASVLVVLTRPQLLVIVLPVLVFLALVGFARWKSPRLSLLPIGAAMLAGGFGITRLLLLQADREWGLFYKVNNYVEKTPSFRAYADAVMPPCPPLQQAMAGPAPWTDAWVIRDAMPQVCPETYLWFQSSKSNLATWALAEPGATVSNAAAVLKDVTLIVQSAGRAMPEWLSALILPDWRVWILALIALGLGAVCAVVAGIRPRASLIGVLGFLVIGAGFATHVFVVWGADGLEIERHLMPASLLLLLSAFLFPAALGRPQPSSNDEDERIAAQVS